MRLARSSLALCFACGVFGALALACGVDATVLRLGAPDAAVVDAPVVDVAIADASTFDGISAADADTVAAGQSSACALSNGVASCWGDNAQSDLGTGDAAMRTSPSPVATSFRFASIALGQSHACAIRAPDASVMCWGGNTYGQIGVGSSVTSFAAPQRVLLPGPAASVTAGYEHTCAVLRDGSLWCWGDNSEGQLGLNDAYGSPNATTPARVGAAVDWMAVAGGQGHTCGIREPGTLWCWGRNAGSELGIGSSQPVQLRAPTQVGTLGDWTFVELGQDGALGLRENGTLWGWGDGASGQLGAPAGQFSSPTQIGAATSWITASTDTFTSCAIQSGGALWCWGRNAEGQLGTGDTNDRASPTQTGSGTLFDTVSVGRFFTCAQSVSQHVLCTGANESGELGLGDTMRRDVFTAVP